MDCPKCGKEMKLTGVDTYYCEDCKVAVYMDYSAEYPPRNLYEEEKKNWGDIPIGYQLGC